MSLLLTKTLESIGHTICRSMFLHIVSISYAELCILRNLPQIISNTILYYTIQYTSLRALMNNLLLYTTTYIVDHRTKNNFHSGLKWTHLLCHYIVYGVLVSSTSHCHTKREGEGALEEVTCAIVISQGGCIPMPRSYKWVLERPTILVNTVPLM